MICRILRAFALASAVFMDAMTTKNRTERPQAPPVVPPVADTAEEWLASLRVHHGPDETCSFVDCRPCWVRTHEAE